MSLSQKILKAFFLKIDFNELIPSPLHKTTTITKMHTDLILWDTVFAIFIFP